MKFVVSDFSAIEARVISWLAGETWKSEAFAAGQDIYCTTASQMFGVPVVKQTETPAAARKNSLYEKLLTALGRLSVIVKNMRGRTNKDVGRLTDQINQLCDKWQ